MERWAQPCLCILVCRSSLEVAQQLADMLRSRPVHTWKEDIAGADSLVNNYLLTFVKTSTLRTT